MHFLTRLLFYADEQWLRKDAPDDYRECISKTYLFISLDSDGHAVWVAFV